MVLLIEGNKEETKQAMNNSLKVDYLTNLGLTKKMLFLLPRKSMI